MADVFVIRAGAHRGQILGIEDGRAKIRGPQPTDEWSPAPLRALAAEYAVGEGPWPWLRTHGIRRPSPSGPRVPETRSEADRGVRVRLEGTAAEHADALAARWGCSRPEAVARALREALRSNG